MTCIFTGLCIAVTVLTCINRDYNFLKRSACYQLKNSTDDEVVSKKVHYYKRLLKYINAIRASNNVFIPNEKVCNGEYPCVYPPRQHKLENTSEQLSS